MCSSVPIDHTSCGIWGRDKVKCQNQMSSITHFREPILQVLSYIEIETPATKLDKKSKSLKPSEYQEPIPHHLTHSPIEKQAEGKAKSPQQTSILIAN
jgi:hypothetical protein